MDAVVFDLFGTLVDAPTSSERTNAACHLAQVIGCKPSTVDRHFRDSWQVRHDGTLPTLADLAAHLVGSVGGPASAARPVADELYALGSVRLIPSPSVTRTLKSLQVKGVRLGVLSDASAEIATAWSTSPLAELVDAAVFSCTAGSVKPDERLYKRVSDEVNVPADRTLYVGDGGGDELRGAVKFGMTVVAVHRRGPDDALAFGDTEWIGPALHAVEQVPAHLAELP